MHRFGIRRVLLLLAMVISVTDRSIADETVEKSIEQQRLETMREFVFQMKFTSESPAFPKSLSEQPLFRYDDLARGYVDGAVWRLGTTGRPKAIVTSELHPKYGNLPRIVCDYLSFSDHPFKALVMTSKGLVIQSVVQSDSTIYWTPQNSAVTFNKLDAAPKLAATKAQRLFQLKKMAERFSGHQTVEGQKLELRLLPHPIDRYQPTESDNSDGAIFVFVSGRNPGIVLVIEATEAEWQYGVGRLSGPSTLTLQLEGAPVWEVAPASYEWNGAYTASNFDISIPGF